MVVGMFDIAATIACLLAVWRWGDWRNIKSYHPTLLYLVFGDLYYYFLTQHHVLWRLEAVPLIPYRVITETLGLICFVCTTQLFLAHLPKRFLMSILWVAFWVFVYGAGEWFMAQFHLIGYYNGWALRYSIFFDMLMFPMLWLHYKRPVIAYGLTLPIIAFLLWVNRVPLY